MIEMEDIDERAVSHFKEGYNCCESVLMGYMETNKISSNIVPRIATGFGGGIARRGSVCGALTGAIMAIGLMYGRDRLDQDAYDLCVAKSSECYERFKKEFGDVQCRNLIGCDLSTSEGRNLFKKMGLREKNCMKYVRGASTILLDLAKQ
ncbi:MAG: C-GCAxxG-C-C family protein [Nitrososphaeria archaeon]